MLLNKETYKTLSSSCLILIDLFYIPAHKAILLLFGTPLQTGRVILVLRESHDSSQCFNEKREECICMACVRQ